MTSDMMSREELRVLMLPWVGVLRDYVDVGEWHSTRDASGDRRVWIPMVSDTPRGIEPRAFDAMELLTLLGEIDFVAWRAALAVAWPRHAGLWIEAANGHALRFGWKLVFHSHSGNDAASMDIAKWCDRIVVDGAVRTCPHEYLRARTVLENLYKQHATASVRTVRRPLARERLLIPVQLVVHDGPLETRLLKLLQLAALQHARETSPVSLFRDDPWKPLMRLTNVDTGDSIQHASPKAFLSATQLAAFAVRLKQLSLDGLHVTVDTAMLYVTGLQYLLATVGDATPSVGAVDAAIVPRIMQRQTVDAIYSAIAVSASVHKVLINKPSTFVDIRDDDVTKMTADDRDHMWQWIGVSLFGSRVSNSVTSVEIDVGDLRQKDVAAMEKALSLECPLHAVCAHTMVRGDKSVDGDEYVTASEFRLLPPDTEAPQGVQSTVNVDVQKVPVLYRLSDHWVVVMLPGWGTAWVHDNEKEGGITHSIDKGDTRPPLTLRLSNVTSLATAPVVSLLRLMGSKVKTLELVGIKTDAPLDEWLRTIFQLCPSLEELEILSGGTLTTLDTFTDCYKQGICRVRRLALGDTSITAAPCVAGFFHTLADPTHPMSQQLRSFKLTYRSREPLPGVSEAVHAMLKANSILESVSLVVGFLPALPKDQLISRRAFATYETPIAVRLLPLSLNKKAAFLSVTGSRREQESTSAVPSAMHEFDSRIVSRIFQFAAQCRKRSVTVHFWNVRN